MNANLTTEARLARTCRAISLCGKAAWLILLAIVLSFLAFLHDDFNIRILLATVTLGLLLVINVLRGPDLLTPVLLQLETLEWRWRIANIVKMIRAGRTRAAASTSPRVKH